ncbi:MAG: hypothetical protein QM479_00215 [Pseudomonadota bacterium]
MKKILASLTLVVASMPLSFISADDGKALHQEKCTQCHMMSNHSALYTREGRIVKNLGRLKGQVSMCTQNLNIEWFPEEEAEVVKYLNKEYYHFK